jgi:hypothetical protein
MAVELDIDRLRRLTMTTSIELANKFLRGRDSAWLSTKQTKWLTDVLAQERHDDVRHREYWFNTDQINGNPHGYTLNVAPNQASLLKPSPCLGLDCRVCRATN